MLLLLLRLLPGFSQGRRLVEATERASLCTGWELQPVLQLLVWIPALEQYHREQFSAAMATQSTVTCAVPGGRLFSQPRSSA